MSKQPAHCQARALAYLASLEHLAVGHNDGVISVRKLQSQEAQDGSGETVYQLDNIISKMNHPKEWIEIMRYSPDGTKLAVGSHDNFIYIYNVGEGQYKPHGKLKGHSSYITALDWSVTGDWIRSSCGAYELLFFNPETNK